MKSRRIFLFSIFSFLVCNQYQAYSIAHKNHAAVSTFDFQVLDEELNGFSENKETIINIIQLILLQQILGISALITHELGHAVAATSLFKQSQPPQIHIGACTINDDTWFSIGQIHFHKGFWYKGLTRYEADMADRNALLKRVVIHGAGGVSAAAFLYSFLSIIAGYCSYVDNKNSFKAFCHALKSGYKPFANILETRKLSFEQKRLLINISFIASCNLIKDLFYGLTPFYCPGLTPQKNNCDGMKVWKYGLGFEGTSLHVAQGCATAGALGSLWLLIKNFRAAHKRLLAQRAAQEISPYLEGLS